MEHFVGTYHAYICSSSQWQLKRLERIDLDLGRCRLCNNERPCWENLRSEDVPLTVHHRRYPQTSKGKEIWEDGSFHTIWVWDETLDDLTTLCTVCHNEVTNREHGDKWATRHANIHNELEQDFTPSFLVPPKKREKIEYVDDSRDQINFVRSPIKKREDILL